MKSMTYDHDYSAYEESALRFFDRLVEEGKIKEISKGKYLKGGN